MTLSTVAAFDFDGTLTYRDTLLPFLLYCDGRFTAASKLLTISPLLAFDVVRGIDRQKMKERVLTRFFQGTSLVDLRQKGQGFASEALPPHVRPEGLKRLKWHQDQGHRCILISASVDVYLEPWAQALGFNDIITSKMEEDSQGKATGRLLGKNCRGQEKVCRLEALIGPKEGNYTLYAYGDSPGDKELLQRADHPFMKEMPDV
ncbi:MAG: HAD family hydrolase [Chlamydiales bacterium]|nr:HAD family hydrolase [Chlamydiales bacterium]